MVASYYNRLITDSGMGTMLNFLRVMLFPVFRQRKVYLPCKLAVVPIKVALRVHALYIQLFVMGVCLLQIQPFFLV